jgi:hypothetical protein
MNEESFMCLILILAVLGIVGLFRLMKAVTKDAARSKKLADSYQVGMCWYCRKVPAEPDYAVTFSLHKAAGTKSAPGGVAFFFDEVEVMIPSCRKCNTRQEKIKEHALRWTLIGTAILAIPFILFFISLSEGNNLIESLLAIAAAFMAAGLFVGLPISLVLNATLPGKPPVSPAYYSKAKELLSDGWSIGSMPMGIGNNLQSKRIIK